MGTLAVSLTALVVAVIMAIINWSAYLQARRTTREAEANLEKARQTMRCINQPVDHKREAPSPVLTDEQWRALYNAPTPK